MARRATAHTQADLTRMIKAAVAAGVPIERIAGIKVTRDSAVLLFGEMKPKLDEERTTGNEWDAVLGEGK